WSAAPVCAGTAKAWRHPGDGLAGGAFWPFRVRPFPLRPLPCSIPSPLPLDQPFDIGPAGFVCRTQCGAGARQDRTEPALCFSPDQAVSTGAESAAGPETPAPEGMLVENEVRK